MFKKKNSVALLLFLVTGVLAYNAYFHRNRGGSILIAPSTNSGDLHDSLAANSATPTGNHLTMPVDNGDDIKDSVAANPAEIGSGVGGHQGNNQGGNNGGTPHGTNDGGNGAGGNNPSPASQQAPPILSPSGPQ